MVPVSRQTPPTIRRFSTTATRFPSLAAWTAARWPAGPLPMHTRSKSKGLLILLYSPILLHRFALLLPDCSFNQLRFCLQSLLLQAVAPVAKDVQYALVL